MVFLRLVKKNHFAVWNSQIDLKSEREILDIAKIIIETRVINSNERIILII